MKLTREEREQLRQLFGELKALTADERKLFDRVAADVFRERREICRMQSDLGLTEEQATRLREQLRAIARAQADAEKSRIKSTKGSGHCGRLFSVDDMKRPVVNVDTGERYASAADAARAIGRSPQAVHQAIYVTGKRGSVQRCAGFRFEYVEPEALSLHSRRSREGQALRAKRRA